MGCITSKDVYEEKSQGETSEQAAAPVVSQPKSAMIRSLEKVEAVETVHITSQTSDSAETTSTAQCDFVSVKQCDPSISSDEVEFRKICKTAEFKISQAEVVLHPKIVTNIDRGVMQSTVKDIFCIVDKDADGFIEYSEFLELLDLVAIAPIRSPKKDITPGTPLISDSESPKKVRILTPKLSPVQPSVSKSEMFKTGSTKSSNDETAEKPAAKRGFMQYAEGAEESSPKRNSRFFVLDGGVLSYMDSNCRSFPMSLDQRGISLKGLNLVVNDEANTLELHSPTEVSADSSRRMSLEVRNENERKMWIEALNEHIKYSEVRSAAGGKVTPKSEETDAVQIRCMNENNMVSEVDF